MEELTPDRSHPIAVDQINEAKELLIQRRQTHLGQLTDKRREERVRSVIEPILSGGVLEAVPKKKDHPGPLSSSCRQRAKFS